MKHVELEYPVEWNGKKVSSLTIRRPTVGDVFTRSRNEKEDEYEAALKFLADLTGVDSDIIVRLDYKDWNSAYDIACAPLG